MPQVVHVPRASLHAQRACVRVRPRAALALLAVMATVAAMIAMLVQSTEASARGAGWSRPAAGHHVKPQLAGGASHMVALRSNGTVWSWGDNAQGQLGSGSTATSSASPVQVRVSADSPLTDVIAIASGRFHSLAVRADGSVFAWGGNAQGQLGDGSLVDARWAIRVRSSSTAFLAGARSASAGTTHSVVVLDDGTVWSWGGNANGELGTGNTTPSRYPVQARYSASIPLTDVKEVAAGGYHTVALRHDGTVHGWGFNGGGQTGSGDTVTPQPWVVQARMTATTYIRGVKALATCGNCTLVLEADGDVLSWGSGSDGQLGHGGTTGVRFPQQVMVAANSPLPKARGLGGGDASALYRSYAVTATGSVYGWGNNDNGELGTGDTTMRTYATRVTTDGAAGLDRVVAVAGGGRHAAILRADGAVLTWGANASGQLGTGGSTPRLLPGIGPTIAGTGITAVAAGGNHSVGLRANGSVIAWGANTSGQLGTGGTNAANRPRPVMTGSATALTDVLAVSAAGASSLAVRVDGSVWAWGDNGSGQLGSGIVGGSSSYATRVDTASGAALSEVITPASAVDHALALRANGTLWSWGSNSNGRLGDGSFANRARPGQVLVGTDTPLVETIQVATKGAHSIALSVDGQSRAWGANESGQLGIGTTVQQAFAVAVLRQPGVALAGITSVAAGDAHSTAVGVTGSLVAWGSNQWGQLGDGTSSPRVFADGAVSRASGVPVPPVAEVAAGAGHTLALLRDGTAVATGRNDTGQLCDGTLTGRSFAAQVVTAGGSTLTGAAAPAAGGAHTLVLRSTGSTWACGRNDDGQLGNQGSTRSNTTVETHVQPDAPFSAGQFEADGATAIPVGGTTVDGITTNVVIRFSLRDVNESQALTPWVEVVPDGASFTATCGAAGPAMHQGQAVTAGFAQLEVAARVDVTSLSSGTSYRWRACVTDEHGLASDWYLHGGAPDFTPDNTIFDNQPGDDTWRRSNSGTYDVDFADAGSLLDFSVQVWTEQAGGGSLVQDWTRVSTVSGTLYTTDWQLPASTWSLLSEGTSFVSVRRTGTATAVATRRDVFYVRKDTIDPPAVAPNASSPVTRAPELTWSTVSEPAPGSGVRFYRVYRSTSAGVLGSLVSIDGSVTSGSFTDGSLQASGRYHYSVRAVDVAGNERQSVDTQVAVEFTAPLHLHAASSTLLTQPAPARLLRATSPTGPVDASSTLVVPRNNTNHVGQFVQWRSGTSNTAAPQGSLPGTPTGYGWVHEDSPSRSYVSGTWRFSFPLTFDRTVSGTVHVKAWKVGIASGGISNPVELCVATPPCGWTASATVGASGTHGVDVGMPATSFGPGEYLYVEYWWRIASQASQAATAGFQTNTSGSHIIPTMPPAAPSLSLAVDATDVHLGQLLPTQDGTATSRLTVASDDPGGYRLLARDQHDSWGASAASSTIADWSGSTTSPTAWQAGAGGHFGLSVRSATGGRMAKWGTAGEHPERNFTDNLYAGLRGTSDGLLHSRSGPTSGSDTLLVTYRGTVDAAQSPGSYAAAVTFTLTASP